MTQQMRIETLSSKSSPGSELNKGLDRRRVIYSSNLLGVHGLLSAHWLSSEPNLLNPERLCRCCSFVIAGRSSRSWLHPPSQFHLLLRTAQSPYPSSLESRRAVHQFPNTLSPLNFPHCLQLFRHFYQVLACSLRPCHCFVSTEICHGLLGQTESLFLCYLYRLLLSYDLIMILFGRKNQLYLNFNWLFLYIFFHCLFGLFGERPFCISVFSGLSSAASGSQGLRLQAVLLYSVTLPSFPIMLSLSSLFPAWV